MKKNINITATNNGKKVTKNVGFINPDVSNAVADTFAKKFNALSTDEFVNTEIVKKMDASEEEGGGGSGKQEGIITLTEDEEGGTIANYNGDGTVRAFICPLGQESIVADQRTWKEINLANGHPTLATYRDYFFFAAATDNYTAAVTIK